MEFFGSRSSWTSSPFMGQSTYVFEGTPPYFGEWGIHVGGGLIGDSGRVGPFNTINEAFNAAVAAGVARAPTALPENRFAQVRDSQGRPVGPVT